MTGSTPGPAFTSCRKPRLASSSSLPPKARACECWANGRRRSSRSPGCCKSLQASLAGAAAQQAWDLSQASSWITWARSCCGTTGAASGRSSWNCCRRSARCWSAWRTSRWRRRARKKASWLGSLLAPGRVACCAPATTCRSFVRLIGQLALNLLRLARAPHRGPWRDFSGHLYRIGATALPITALVGFLIGVVLAYLTSQQLRSSAPTPTSSTSWASR